MAGHLEKRGKNSWRLIVSHGYDSYGNRIRYTKSIHANSRREADKELAPKTYERYKGMLDSRILPYFGHYKLDLIKPAHIQISILNKVL